MLYKVIVVGELCEDILMHNPDSVEVLGMKVWAEDINVTAGGSLTYSSEVLKRLGVDVNLCTVVGDDSRGQRLLARMLDIGANCDQVKILPNSKTTASMMICKGEEKEFLGCSPMLPMILPGIDMLNDADMVYIAGYMLYPELWTDKAYDFFKEVKTRNIHIAMDAQMFPNYNLDCKKLAKIDRILPFVDTFFVARKEALQIVESDEPEFVGQKLLDMGCDTVVLKQGKDGCIIKTKNETVKVCNYPVDAYETVGSGDIFGASYCYGVLNNWGIKECAEFATVFTALSLKEYEEYKEYPDIKTVQKILKNIKK